MQDNMNSYQFDSIFDGSKVEKKSVYKKIYIGIFITIASYIVGLFLNFPAMIASEGLGIALWFGLIFMQMFLYRNLQKVDKVKNSGITIYFVYAMIEGLQLSYLVSLFSIIYLGESVMASLLANQIIGAVAVLTFAIALITGVIASKMEVNEKNLSLMNSIGKVIQISVIALFIVFIVAIVSSLFGFSGLSDSFMNLYYGTGPISIGLSLLFTGFASFSLLRSFYKVNVATKQELSSDYEYALAALVLTDIVWVFVELLKLVLKLMSKSRN